MFNKMTEKDYFHLPSLKNRIIKKRRHLSITLKIPDLDSSPRSCSLNPKTTISIIRTSSVAGNYKTSREQNSILPLHQTTVSFDPKLQIDAVSYFFSPIKVKYLPLPPRINNRKKFENIPEIRVKAETKKDDEKSVDAVLLSHLHKFYTNVQNKYPVLFAEIDRENKGFFDIDDVIDFFIMKNLGIAEQQYERLKIDASEIFRVFELISGKKTVTVKVFLSFCSILEYHNIEKVELNDRKLAGKMKTWIGEMKELFECFTDKKLIDVKAIFTEICLKDRISKARGFVEKEKIDFCRFLRCLPFFVWVYNTVNNSIN